MQLRRPSTWTSGQARSPGAWRESGCQSGIRCGPAPGSCTASRAQGIPAQQTIRSDKLVTMKNKFNSFRTTSLLWNSASTAARSIPPPRPSSSSSSPADFPMSLSLFRIFPISTLSAMFSSFSWTLYCSTSLHSISFWLRALASAKFLRFRQDSLEASPPLAREEADEEELTLALRRATGKWILINNIFIFCGPSSPFALMSEHLTENPDALRLFLNEARRRPLTLAARTRRLTGEDDGEEPDGGGTEAMTNDGLENCVQY